MQNGKNRKTLCYVNLRAIMHYSESVAPAVSLWVSGDN